MLSAATAAATAPMEIDLGNSEQVAEIYGKEFGEKWKSWKLLAKTTDWKEVFADTLVFCPPPS